MVNGGGTAGGSGGGLRVAEVGGEGEWSSNGQVMVRVTSSARASTVQNKQTPATLDGGQVEY